MRGWVVCSIALSAWVAVATGAPPQPRWEAGNAYRYSYSALAGDATLSRVDARLTATVVMHCVCVRPDGADFQAQLEQVVSSAGPDVSALDLQAKPTLVSFDANGVLRHIRYHKDDPPQVRSVKRAIFVAFDVRGASDRARRGGAPHTGRLTLSLARTRSCRRPVTAHRRTFRA